MNKNSVLQAVTESQAAPTFNCEVCDRYSTKMPVENAALAWDRTWATWGLVRRFTITCCPEFDPIRSMIASSDECLGPDAVWVPLDEVLEEPGRFVVELGQSKLNVSETAFKKLATIIDPLKLITPASYLDKKAIRKLVYEELKRLFDNSREFSNGNFLL